MTRKNRGEANSGLPKSCMGKRVLETHGGASGRIIWADCVCPYIAFGNLSGISGLLHASFTRHGGVSNPPCESLNVGSSNGDAPDSVRENIERIRACLGFDLLASARQVHGDTIRVVDEDVPALAGEHTGCVVLPPADALVTAMRGIGLLVKIADCQAVMLADPVKGVVANVHSGWRGSVRNVVGKVVGFMESRFGSRPRDIAAAVSPSLGPCCAEFRNFRDEIPPELWGFQVRPEYFDFWAVTAGQLTGAGVLAKNIEIAGRCTKCGSADFFSYRAEGATGRMAAVIGWKR
jgi:polyphenol oxidase